MNANILLAKLVYLFSLADLFFTWLILSGNGIELNPVVRAMPLWLYALLKIVLVGALLLRLGRQESKAVTVGLAGLAVFYSGIVAYYVIIFTIGVCFV